MDLHQVDVISLEPHQRLFQLVARRGSRAPVDFGHQKGFLPVTTLESLAHPYFAGAIVVIPAVVEEIDAFVQGFSHNAEGLRFRNIGEPYMVAADPEDRDFGIGSTEFAPPDSVDGGHRRQRTVRGRTLQFRLCGKIAACETLPPGKCSRRLFEEITPFHPGPPSQIQLPALRMAHAGLSAAVRYQNSTGIQLRPERIPF